MTKSSYAAALFLAGWGAEAAAQPPSNEPVTADAAMARYHQWLSGSDQPACATPGRSSDEDIVVCGRTHKPPERSPLPVAREAGEIVRHINEPGNAVEAMRGPPCIHSCYKPVGVNPIEVILAVPKVIRHILHGDD